MPVLVSGFRVFAIAALAMVVYFTLIRVLTVIGFFEFFEGFIYGQLMFVPVLAVVAVSTLTTARIMRQTALVELVRAWKFILISGASFLVGEILGIVTVVLRLQLPQFQQLVNIADWFFFLGFVMLSYGVVTQYSFLKTETNMRKVLRNIGTAPSEGQDQGSMLSKWLGSDIEKYRVILVSVQGSFAIEHFLDRLMNGLKVSHNVVLMLGPTNPYRFAKEGLTVVWVTEISERLEDIAVLSPKNLTEISLFVSNVTKLTKESRPILTGDFLDNVLPHMQGEALSTFYSIIVNKLRTGNVTGIFLIAQDLHDGGKMSILKRFADALVELRESEVKGSRVEEMRVSNMLDRVYHNWEELSGF